MSKLGGASQGLRQAQAAQAAAGLATSALELSPWRLGKEDVDARTQE